MEPMQFSRNGYLFLGCREALVLVGYQDGEHCSAGFGHNDPNLKLGQPITVKQAFDWLKEDIVAREKIVNRGLTVQPTQGQYDAFVDLVYQSGNRYTRDSTHPTTKVVTPGAFTLFNAGRLDELRAAWPHYSKRKSGEEMSGLVKRRMLELAIFNHDDYGDLDKILYWTSDPTTTKPTGYYKLQPGDLDDIFPPARVAANAHVHHDGCLCDIQLAAHEMTPDHELPPSAGGVA